MHTTCVKRHVPSLLTCLPPGAFAFVMATGIVAHDARLTGSSPIGPVLTWLSVFGYVALIVLTAARAVCFPRSVLDDLRVRQREAGFLTVVPATCLVGTELVPMDTHIAAGAWLLGTVLWLGLTYAFFVAVGVQSRQPDTTETLTGSSLLTVVATQAVALLGALVAPSFGSAQALVFFVSLSFFLGGCALYLMLIPGILHRLEFVALTPIEFTPDHWIDMGAMAITSLAGSTLVTASDSGAFPILQQLRPFLIGLAILCWAGATWWIPLLVLLQAGRNLVRRVPIVYATEYWSMVFPLGMYAACTFGIAGVVGVDGLDAAAHWLTYVALVVWLLVFAGLVRNTIAMAQVPLLQNR